MRPNSRKLNEIFRKKMLEVYSRVEENNKYFLGTYFLETRRGEAWDSYLSDMSKEIGISYDRATPRQPHGLIVETDDGTWFRVGDRLVFVPCEIAETILVLGLP
jgi:hypothetical protein